MTWNKNLERTMTSGNERNPPKQLQLKGMVKNNDERTRPAHS